MKQLPNNLKRCVIDEVKQKDKELRKKQKEEEELLKQSRLDDEMYGI